jgi:hypothetical protein
MSVLSMFAVVLACNCVLCLQITPRMGTLFPEHTLTLHTLPWMRHPGGEVPRTALPELALVCMVVLLRHDVMTVGFREMKQLTGVLP